MSPVTHLLAGWLVANVDDLNRRERAAVTLASIAPDIDGIGAPIESLTRWAGYPVLLYSDFHRSFGHNLAFGVIVAAVCALLVRQRWRTAGLALLIFHLHLLGDLAGARGPDGSQWPIPYLWPFDASLQWTWSGQWELNAWPNFLITGLLLVATFYLAWKRGSSPVEIISGRADAKFVATLRRRFGPPVSGTQY